MPCLCFDVILLYTLAGLVLLQKKQTISVLAMQYAMVQWIIISNDLT
jgi:hypothetical protein